jgi:hypothetical protein
MRHSRPVGSLPGDCWRVWWASGSFPCNRCLNSHFRHRHATATMLIFVDVLRERKCVSSSDCSRGSWHRFARRGEPWESTVGSVDVDKPPKNTGRNRGFADAVAG